jgi:hypothetical protein
LNYIRSIKKAVKMQQSELPLDDRRLSPPPPPDKEDPESSVVQETLAPVLKRRLSEAEWNRLVNHIKRVDYGLDLIKRDRKIKEAVQKRLDKGQKLYDAVLEVAGRFHISDEHVYTIWYGKKERDGEQ